MAKTVIVTGSSTGFGKLIATHFAEKGWNVVATMRSPDKETELTKLANVVVTRLDVEDQASVDAAVKLTIDKFGAIDVLVNNAGYANFGFVEATSIEDVQKQMNTNFFGVVRVSKAVIPHMRAAKSGKIVIVSSVIGSVSSPATSTYAASKWAIEGWAESALYELLPFNIQMKLVQPGAYATPIFAKVMDPANGNMLFDVKGTDDYKPMADGIGAMFAGMKPADPNPAVPQCVLEAATNDEPTKLRFPVYAEEDGYAKVYQARKALGDEAQIGAVLASLAPKEEEKKE